MLWQVFLCARRNSRILWSLLLLTACFSSFAEEEWDIEELIQQEVIIDLRDPVYEEGELRTEQGGVIATDCIRIQGRFVSYIQTDEKHQVEAEGDLMIEYAGRVFVGSYLFYDFNTQTGWVCDGRTGIEPWFLGGDRIYLREDGSYFIQNAYVTTSENACSEWAVTSSDAIVEEYRFLRTSNLKFRLGSTSLFWIPSFRVDMASLLDSPLRYTVRVGGKKGPRVGVVYEMYASESWKTFARVDYRLERGFGGGLEFFYKPPNKIESFHSINYFANDISLSDPGERKRYRLLGDYFGESLSGKTSLYVHYDKLSDRDMATDYNDRGLELVSAKPAQLHVRHQETNWITNFLTKVRINNFQTVKQQLPTLAGSIRPYELSNTGIIADGNYKISYLDFEYDKYDKSDSDISDYNSTRVEFGSRIYRPFCIGPVTATPEAEGIAIYYGNNPGQDGQWLTAGRFAYEINSDFSRCFQNWKHVVTPYTNYQYITYPSLNPSEHHIFDIEDGWFSLNQLTVGTRHHLIEKNRSGLIWQRLYADFYAHAFFDTSTIPQLIPKVYADIRYYSTPCMRHTLDTAWDFNQGLLDHINLGTDITVSANAAISFEYRHRSAYDWRKADSTNFILDSYQTIQDLKNSAVSDKRDTLLFHIFYRFFPEWIFEFQSRHGWNRSTEDNYDEYLFNLLGNLRSAWHVRLSYRHKMNEDRFSFNVSIGIDKPLCAPDCPVPLLQF